MTQFQRNVGAAKRVLLKIHRTQDLPASGATSMNTIADRWAVLCKGKKQEIDFASESEAEESIDDQFPSHRF